MLTDLIKLTLGLGYPETRLDFIDITAVALDCQHIYLCNHPAALRV